MAVKRNSVKTKKINKLFLSNLKSEGFTSVKSSFFYKQIFSVFQPLQWQIF
jgi:hypothetical protein